MFLPILALTLVVQATPQRPAPADARGATTTATAVRATQQPNIDGRNLDVVWQSAPKYSEFRQFEPRVDSAPSFKTEFQVAYDERNLYVFVRMFDPHPDSIMHALSRRDVRGPSDQIKLLIDSYDDKRIRIRVRRESGRCEARLRHEQRRQRGRLLERRYGTWRRPSIR